MVPKPKPVLAGAVAVVGAAEDVEKLNGDADAVEAVVVVVVEALIKKILH